LKRVHSRPSSFCPFLPLFIKLLMFSSFTRSAVRMHARTQITRAVDHISCDLPLLARTTMTKVHDAPSVPGPSSNTGGTGNSGDTTLCSAEQLPCIHIPMVGRTNAPHHHDRCESCSPTLLRRRHATFSGTSRLKRNYLQLPAVPELRHGVRTASCLMKPSSSAPGVRIRRCGLCLARLC
jgi:hypothetical protein